MKMEYISLCIYIVYVNVLLYNYTRLDGNRGHHSISVDGADTK